MCRFTCMRTYKYMTDFVVEMSMDKSWIYMKNHLCDEYWDGLSAFIKIAKNYANSLWTYQLSLYQVSKPLDAASRNSESAHTSLWF